MHAGMFTCQQWRAGKTGSSQTSCRDGRVLKGPSNASKSMRINRINCEDIKTSRMYMSL